MKKLFLALIIFVAFFIFVLYTSTGLRLALFVTSKVLPGKLAIKNATGRLADDISLTSLSYKKGDITIKLSNVNLNWNPYYLLVGKLIIKRLDANNIVVSPNKIVINKLNATLFTTGKSVNFADINLYGPNIAFKLKGQLHKQYDYNWLLHFKNLSMTGKIDGRKGAPELKTVLPLKLLETFFPGIKNSQGDLNINFKLSGTLDKPRLQGKAVLYNGSVYIPAANLKLRNINLAVNGDLYAIDYTGQIFSGDGYIKINGKTDLDKTGFPTIINITGKDFLASNTDNIKIKITPTLQLSLNKRQLNIEGKILVPWAKLELHDFSSTETLPNDVVFVDKKGKKPMPANFSVYSKIRLILGNNIYVNARGLKGRLDGQLEIIRQPKVSPQAFGSIAIYDGSYNIYGTELKLEKSKITFNGHIDNPSLDIKASRTFKTVGAMEDLIVGAYINGTLIYPKTILYSKPSGLSQEDILSYLMFGTSSSQLSQDKASLLMKAVGALHFGGPSTLTMLTDNLREKFGLTEFGLAAEAIGEKPEEMTTNTVFVMGKYILPYLYISYSVGLLDAVNIFRVRYKFGEKWAIQSESSSLGNGIDFLYSIVKK